MGSSRLFTSFAVMSALGIICISACSENESKPSSDSGGAGSGGTAGQSGHSGTSKGGVAGSTATTTTSKGGTAGTSSHAAAGAAPIGTVGTAGTAGTAGVAGGGASPTVSTLDDLIGAICDWEFRCCDAGEVRWQLGPITTSAAACKENFVYFLRNDTSAGNPYPSLDSKPSGSSPAINGLLIKLAYEVDMNNVTENPAGIAACIAQWNTKSCNPAPDPKPTAAHCTLPAAGRVAPCDLVNLVTPKLNPGEICNVALTQGTYNDVECKPGSTCLASTNVDNPNKSHAACVTRGVTNAPCNFDKDCDFDFYCSRTTGKCTQKGGAGAACAYKTPSTPKPGELTLPCKPGLSCNPLSLVCVEDCSVDYVCNTTPQDDGDDYLCPSGTSCIPLTLGNDSTSFKVCRAVGAAGASCNSLEDCGAGLYCAAATCAAQKSANVACSTSTPGECAAGLYCAEGATPGSGTCAAFIPNSGACVQASHTIASAACEPTTTIGCISTWDATKSELLPICGTALLTNGQRCGADMNCQSGRCEFAAEAPKFKTCIAGAALDAPCDSGTTEDELTSTEGKTRCGPGLTCDTTTSKCVAQVGPGGSCVDTSGAANARRCANASCNATQWTPIDSSYVMCTDAAVAPYNGGTGVICDGR